MINKLKKLCGLETKYIEWNNYLKKIEFITTYEWQQSIRRENIKRIK